MQPSPFVVAGRVTRTKVSKSPCAKQPPFCVFTEFWPIRNPYFFNLKKLQTFDWLLNTFSCFCCCVFRVVVAVVRWYILYPNNVSAVGLLLFLHCIFSCMKFSCCAFFPCVLTVFFAVFVVVKPMMLLFAVLLRLLVYVLLIAFLYVVFLFRSNLLFFFLLLQPFSLISIVAFFFLLELIQ